MAEAMLAGKPVIATGYSGNLEFMNETNSFLVGCRRAGTPMDAGPIPQAPSGPSPTSTTRPG